MTICMALFSSHRLRFEPPLPSTVLQATLYQCSVRNTDEKVRANIQHMQCMAARWCIEIEFNSSRVSLVSKITPRSRFFFCVYANLETWGLHKRWKDCDQKRGMLFDDAFPINEGLGCRLPLIPACAAIYSHSPEKRQHTTYMKKSIILAAALCIH